MSSLATAGSIFRSTNPSGQTVYKVDVPDGYYANGRRKYVRRTAATKGEAKALQRKLVAEIESNRLLPTREETLETYALWWLRNVKANQVRYSTAGDYEDRLRRWVLPYFGKLKLSGIQSRNVESWMAALKHKGYATNTVNGARRILNMVMKHAYQGGLIYRNPVEVVTPYKKNRDEPTQVRPPWTKEEVFTALKAAEETEFDLMLNIALLLGLRRGELLGLRWDDFDVEVGQLQIDRTLKQERRFSDSGKANVSLVTDKTKTKESERTLKTGFNIAAAVMRHRERIKELKQAAGDRWKEQGWMFPSAVGTPTNPNNFYKRFVRFCKNHGLRQIRIHDLRHTSAVLGLEAGVRIEAVSQALGHSRIDVTKSIYAPYVQVLADEFTERVDDYLNEHLLQKLLVLESEVDGNNVVGFQ